MLQNKKLYLMEREAIEKELEQENYLQYEY